MLSSVPSVNRSILLSVCEPVYPFLLSGLGCYYSAALPCSAATPRHRYTGLTVIELGSGPGLAGLLAAKLGAQVVITDKAVVLPLITENIKLNGISHTPTANCSGTAEVRWVSQR